MNLSELRNTLPDYAKDLKLNLDSVLSETGAAGLSEAIGAGGVELTEAVVSGAGAGVEEVALPCLAAGFRAGRSLSAGGAGAPASEARLSCGDAAAVCAACTVI